MQAPATAMEMAAGPRRSSQKEVPLEFASAPGTTRSPFSSTSSARSGLGSVLAGWDAEAPDPFKEFRVGNVPRPCGLGVGVETPTGAFGDDEGLAGLFLVEPDLADPGSTMSPSGTAWGLVLAGGAPSRPANDRDGERAAEVCALANG